MTTKLYEAMCIRYDAAFDKVDFQRLERLALEDHVIYLDTLSDLSSLRYQSQEDHPT